MLNEIFFHLFRSVIFEQNCQLLLYWALGLLLFSKADPEAMQRSVLKSKIRVKKLNKSDKINTKAVSRHRNEKLTLTNKQLDQHRDLLEFAACESGMALWEVDVVTQELYESESISNLFKISVMTDPGAIPCIGFFCQDGQPILENELKKALEQSESYRLELMLANKKGKEQWVLAVGLPVLKDGQVVKLRGFFQDIDQQKKAKIKYLESIDHFQQRLNEREIHLNVINKELEALTYSVSHDLTTPLRSIKGFSLAIIEDYDDELAPQAKGYLQRISRAAHRMENQISDLLSLVELSEQEIDPVTLDISRLCEEVITGLQPDKKFDIYIESGLTAIGDRKLIRVMMENLLANAVKFSAKSDNPKIEVARFAENNETGIMVKDNGVGFDMTYAGRLFGAFHKLHKSDEFPGSGIGLAMVQRIINKHEGRIWANSQIGKGTTFYIVLKDIPR
ncbi:ATP-binding protein [Fulvivirga sp. M361]|uniref:sensor histidine kinase n=1 Tax=Fulvivirga sp. M361 TaxID=2594266 RepID=UPI001626E824|nr:PAS domain-containing sensor histidine kinase [Fulvivirga sp. M361]